MYIGNMQIPLVFWGNFLKMLFICVSIALAYNMGADWSIQTYKLLHESAYTGYGGCTPIAVGNQISWNCSKIQTNDSIKIPNYGT
jgi:hypothetical protein